MQPSLLGILYLLVLMFAVIRVPGPVSALRNQVAVLGALFTGGDVVALAQPGHVVNLGGQF